jgi:WhiB family transcriptional regulator, redox-sensing transcriptional regulator
MNLKPPWEFENPLCAEIGLDLYYKDEDVEDDRALVHGEQQKAIEMCKTCEHLSDCAEWGINRERWGVWGGLTPRERRNIRRARRRSKFLNVQIELLP